MNMIIATALGGSNISCSFESFFFVMCYSYKTLLSCSAWCCCVYEM